MSSQQTVDSQSGSLRNNIDDFLNGINSNSSRHVNVSLIFIIFISVICSMLLTVKALPDPYRDVINVAEKFFVAIFLFEYLARLYSAPDRKQYVFSAYGMVDLVAILPALFFGANETFALRLIRTISLLRGLKLLRYARDVKLLLTSLGKSSFILLMLITGIVMVSLIGGNIIYLVEPDKFSSAFEGMWWSLVTMSTVGYGDVVPHTAGGRIIAGSIMIIGVVMFAVVTGLISSRIFEATHLFERVHCHSCHASIEPDSNYCSQCGVNEPCLAKNQTESS